MTLLPLSLDELHFSTAHPLLASSWKKLAFVQVVGTHMVTAWWVPPLRLLWGYSLAMNVGGSHLSVVIFKGIECESKIEMPCFISWGLKFSWQQWLKDVWQQPDNFLSFKECLDQIYSVGSANLAVIHNLFHERHFSSSPKLCNSIEILPLNSPGLREVHADV